MFIKESIPEELASIRVDTWVHHRWPWLPYRAIQKAIRTGIIRVEGKRIQAQNRLRAGQNIQIRSAWLNLFPPPHPRGQLSSVWKERVDSWVLYEDEHLIALNKPQGIASQGGSGQTVHIDELLARWRPHSTLRLVHRLDKDTTGVLIIAKTLACAQELTRAFGQRKIRKVYWAIVQGHPPLRGRMSQALERLHRKVIVSTEITALPAFTSYICKARGVYPESSVLYRFSPEQAQEIAWIELYPSTGRTHQLRVHLQNLGYPILGDTLYHSSFVGPLALHCYQLTFTYRAKTYCLKAQPPSFFTDLLKNMKTSILI